VRVPFFCNLDGVNNILVAGAGGGYDVFCGLPLCFSLKRAGKTVHLANLSFGGTRYAENLPQHSGESRHRQPRLSISRKCTYLRG
jgi:hypothetical protein